MTYIGRLVALAPVGCGRQVRAVGFEQDVPQLHVAHDLGQFALFEGHYAPDAEGEIAQFLQFAVGFSRVRVGVENAPDTPAAEFAHEGHGLGPRVARMHGDRQSVSESQFDLAAEGLGLLPAEIAAPVEVQSDLAHGAEGGKTFGRALQVAFDQRQFLAPAGVAVNRRGVQSHHRDAPLRMAAAELEQPAVAFGVDGRQQQPPDAFGSGPGQCLLAVGVERFVVQV